LLKGQRGLSRGRAVFWHSPHYYRKQEPFSAVRQGDWTLVYHHPDRRLELFNLAEDIGETRNLAQENPEKVKVLAKTLGDHLREAGGQMPILKKTGKPVPFPDEVPQKKKGSFGFLVGTYNILWSEGPFCFP
jgi:arylsulfatase A-like enzyme